MTVKYNGNVTLLKHAKNINVSIVVLTACDHKVSVQSLTGKVSHRTETTEPHKPDRI